MARRGRKKIFEWDFVSSSGVSMKVPVHILHSKSDQKFEVDLPDYDINEHHADVNELRKAVFAQLAERLTVSWSPFLYVAVSGSAHPCEEGADEHYQMQADLKLEVKPLEIGTRPDGSKCHRERAYRTVHDGLPDAGKDEKDRWHSHQPMRAYVPDTLANRAALNDLANRFQALLDKLEEFLSPEMIERTLACSLFPALPAPPQEPSS